MVSWPPRADRAQQWIKSQRTRNDASSHTKSRGQHLKKGHLEKGEPRRRRLEKGDHCHPSVGHVREVMGVSAVVLWLISHIGCHF